MMDDTSSSNAASAAAAAAAGGGDDDVVRQDPSSMPSSSSSSVQQQQQKRHANRHVSKFLSLQETNVENYDDEVSNNSKQQKKNHRQYKIQIVTDGRKLTARRLLLEANSTKDGEDEKNNLTLTLPILVKDTPESIGMKVLNLETRQVSIRDIADIIGHYWPVHVIDVEHQEELEGWTLTDLVDYFEDEERLLRQHQEEATKLFTSASTTTTTTSSRRGSSSSSSRSGRIRKAAEKCNIAVSATQKRPRVLNQISLEFSDTPLRKHMQSPQFVRDIDWIDHAWPKPKDDDEKQQQNPNKKKKNLMIPPRVQYYCLTSAGGCYTDFHLDFGGTSVWYHVLNGEKVFCLIPPTDTNLAAYEDWLCRPNQSELFLPDLIQNQQTEVIRITLKANQTLIIPAGWIHAVYTPVDSVVIGGNFLHGMDISVQLKVHCLESRTRVQEKFRFPHFVPINFYAGGMYLQKLRQGKAYPREVEGLTELISSLDSWWKVFGQGESKLHTGPTVYNAAHEACRQNNCSTVEDFLKELRLEHQRVRDHGISANPKVRIVIPDKQSTKPPPPSSPTKIKLKLKLNKSSVSTVPKPQLQVAPPPPPSSTASNGTDATSNATSSTTPRIAVAADTASATTTNKKNKFRIVVSSKAHKTVPPVSNKRKKREDTDWVFDPTAADDEWTPTASNEDNNSRKKKKKATTIGTRGFAGGTHIKRSSSITSTSNTSRKGKQDKIMTARQRLNKRLGG